MHLSLNLSTDVIDAIAEAALSGAPTAQAVVTRGEKRSTVSPSNRQLARTLVEEAFARGFSKMPLFTPCYKSPSAGSTANAVLSAKLTIPFFIKIDDNHKLVEEARNLISIRNRGDLPDSFRCCFPEIYATKADIPPYGYVMEAYGEEYVGFEEVCFKGNHRNDEIARITHRVLDLLFDAYEKSKTDLMRPNLDALYFRRINERLDVAAGLDESMKPFLEQPFEVNGETLEPASHYLAKIEARLDSMAPRFTTFVHGDSHPENILIRMKTGKIDVGFIDPKTWRFGDYIFDIGKFLHYLEVTGPTEKVTSLPTPEIDPIRRSIAYTLPKPDAAARAIQETRERLETFAEKTVDDPTWRLRLPLSMASNLLGLPAGRLKKVPGTDKADPVKRNAAWIQFAEGMLWLKRAAALNGASAPR